MSFTRAQDSWEEHNVKTCTAEQDDTQVGKKNCTNQQLWYDTEIISNYVQNVLIYFVMMLCCSLTCHIIPSTIAVFTKTTLCIEA